MVMGHCTTRLRTARALALVSVVLALAVPSVALAANTAKFTSATPKAGSASLASTPTVSVVVYDKYGVKGASRYSMSIDGFVVRPAISYVKGFGYKKFKIVYRPKSALTPGRHSIKVSVRDLKSKSSSYSWTYTVRTPPAPPAPVEMPVTVTAASCSSCHGGFPAAHPMTECSGCHGVASPPRPAGSLYDGQPMSVFGPASPNAHTAGCASTPTSHCHASFFPHVLDTDCTRCHNAAFPLIPQQHSIATTEGTHASTNTFCTQSGCHLVSLTKEHYRHSDGSGARLTCSTCHASKDSLVAATIVAASTDCESCHHFATHPGTELKHALPAFDCLAAQCHGGSNATLASIHAKSDLGCAACHRPTVTLTSTCTACHPPAHNLPAAHAATLASATISINGTSYGTHRCSECHGSLDLRTIHGDDCATCHTGRVRGVLGGAWTRGCAQGDCHAGASTAPMHGSINAAHTLAAVPGCVSTDCHVGGTDVAKIHGARGGPGCAACHAAGKTPTLACAAAGCHPSGAPATHNLPVAHAATPASAPIIIGGVTYGTHACSECHASLDLRTIHSGSCAACHATGVQTVLGGSWTRGCAQGGCHLTASGTMKAVHGSITASHTLSATPSCVGAGCHTGGTSVAAIHSAVPGRVDNGCGICHGAGKTPTLVCSNVGCHATGATAVHNSHPSTVTAGIITINGTAYGSHACSECHASLELQTIHGGASSCSKCHSAPAGSVPKGSFTCALGGCHVTKSGNMLAQHGSVNASHTVATTLSCIAAGCHTGGKDVAAIHAVAGGPGCAACHGVGKKPTLVCVTCHPTYPTASPAHASHPSTVAPAAMVIGGTTYGTHACTECHAPLELQSLHGGVSSCVKCHSSPASSVPKGSFACAQNGCHVIASGSMKAQHASITTSHTLSAAPTCVGTGCHSGGANVAAIHSVVAGRTDNGCGICHGVGKTATLDCVTCHPTYPTASAAHASHPSTVTAGAISINGVDYGAHACTDCHAPLELQVLHGGASSCVKCHSGPASTVPKGSFACAQGGCHVTATGNMEAQHGSISASHMLSYTPTCIADGCHVAGSSGRDVAAVHVTVPNRTDNGCGICHGVGKIATLVCATAGCHPDGAPAIHGSHPSTVTAGVISINGVDYGTHSCSECHASLELQAVHGGSSSCAKCHPTPAKTAPKGSFACALNGCHVTPAGDMKTQHGSINASHTLSYTPTCMGTGCHSGGVSGRDVAAIHGVAGGPGCAACHGVGKKASLNCVTCHPTYPTASAAHASHPSAVTAGVISIGGVDYGSHNCSECHAPLDLQSLHGGSTSCVKCHPGPAGTVPQGSFACAQNGCHIIPSGNMKAMHAVVTPAHDTTPVAGDAGCLGCHSGTLAALHVTARVTVNSVVVTSCAVCHANTDATVRGAMNPYLVAGCTDCHGSDLNTIHPGVSHTTTRAVDQVSWGMDNSYHSPASAATTLMNCSDCHTLSLLPLHANYCGACHSATARASVKAAIARHSTNCADCHPSQHMVDVPAHDADYDSGDYNDCGWCHGGSDGCTRCHPAWTPVPNPVTSSDATASYIGNSGNATITLSVTDNVYGTFGINGTYHILDGAHVATGTQILLPYPASGITSHTLTFWSTDWSGKVETSHTVGFTVAHDTLPPVTTNNIVAGQYYTGAQTFALAAVDQYAKVAGTFWQLDATSGVWTSGKSVPVAAPTSAGKVVHTLYFYSVDTAGNIESVRSVTFTMAYGVMFSYASGAQTFVVPAGVTTLRVTLKGASGGDDSYTVLGYGAYGTGGPGGTVVDTITVTPGTTLTVRVGGVGASYASGSPGGWPNGGFGSYSFAGGGGGSSSIAAGTTLWAEAGGGGGAGWVASGTAGGPQGSGVQDATHGLQTGGGGLAASSAGGGGGGWNKGPGGATANAAGTGGTSFIAFGSGVLTLGGNIGNGSVMINY